MMFPKDLSYLIFILMKIFSCTSFENCLQNNQEICDFHALNEVKSRSSSQADQQFSRKLGVKSKSCHSIYEQYTNTSRCQILLARHGENETELEYITHIKHPYMVLNSGERLHTDENGICEMRTWANVGREGYKYLEFILDNYHRPNRFAPINIFCQVDQSHFAYDNEMFLHDVDTLCSIKPINNTIPIIEDGFTHLGRSIFPYMVGVNNDPIVRQHMIKTFHTYYGYDIPDTAHFVPGGCFAVTKEQILSQPFETYHRYLTKRTPKIYGFYMHDKVEATIIKLNYSLNIEESMNSVGNPTLGHVLERSWSIIMNSTCRLRDPWCCIITCNVISSLLNHTGQNVMIPSSSIISSSTSASDSGLIARLWKLYQATIAGYFIR